MQKYLTTGIIFLGLTLASSAFSQNSLMSNGRYMPSGYCFGIVAISNTVVPGLAKESSIIPKEYQKPILTDKMIEDLKQKAIDQAKWEGSYNNWSSDFDNGVESIWDLVESNVNKPVLPLLVNVIDKMKSCLNNFSP
jgi:hypothetical protein